MVTVAEKKFQITTSIVEQTVNGKGSAINIVVDTVDTEEEVALVRDELLNEGFTPEEIRVCTIVNEVDVTDFFEKKDETSFA
jgi:hypothetical protein